MRRVVATLICLALFFAAPAIANDQIWERVCMVMHVSPEEVSRPPVHYVDENNPLIRGMLGAYFPPPIHVVVVCTHDESVLAHEYAHAIMCSDAYQEPIAEKVEKLFK